MPPALFVIFQPSAVSLQRAFSQYSLCGLRESENGSFAYGRPLPTFSLRLCRAGIFQLSDAIILLTVFIRETHDDQNCRRHQISDHQSQIRINQAVEQSRNTDKKRAYADNTAGYRRRRKRLFS